MDKSMISRKESIILTTIDVINELGIQGLSTREVSKREGISNSSLFNHFKSKGELLQSVLDHYEQYDYAIFQTIKSKGLKSKEAIKYFFNSFFTYYENYPAITAIIQIYDVLRFEIGLSEKVESILNNRETYLKEMLEEAQAQGELRADISSECISDVMFGTAKTILLKWRRSGYDFSLRERVMNTMELILDSFGTRNNTNC